MLTSFESLKLHVDPVAILRILLCCALSLLAPHQVGASGLRAALIGGSGNSSSPMTMDQILDVLTTKARTEAEEAQRQLIGALNGLAALLRLAGDGPGAVAAYRQGLATSEANKQEVRTAPAFVKTSIISTSLGSKLLKPAHLQKMPATCT